jgi:hypothetical protein
MLLKPEKGTGYYVGTKYNSSPKVFFTKYKSISTFIFKKNFDMLL